MVARPRPHLAAGQRTVPVRQAAGAPAAPAPQPRSAGTALGGFLRQLAARSRGCFSQHRRLGERGETGLAAFLSRSFTNVVSAEPYSSSRPRCCASWSLNYGSSGMLGASHNGDQVLQVDTRHLASGQAAVVLANSVTARRVTWSCQAEPRASSSIDEVQMCQSAQDRRSGRLVRRQPGLHRADGILVVQVWKSNEK